MGNKHISAYEYEIPAENQRMSMREYAPTSAESYSDHAQCTPDAISSNQAIKPPAKVRKGVSFQQFSVSPVASLLIFFHTCQNV